MALDQLPDKYLYALMKNYGIADTLPQNLQSQFGSMDQQELNSLSMDMANPDFWKNYDMEATGNFVTNTNASKPKEEVQNPNQWADSMLKNGSSISSDQSAWWRQRSQDWETIAQSNPTLSVDQVNQLADKYRTGKEGKPAQTIKYNPDNRNSEWMKGQDFLGYQDLLDKFLDVGPNNPAVAKDQQVGTLMDKYNQYTKENPNQADNTPASQLERAARAGPLGQYINSGVLSVDEATNLVAGVNGGMDKNVLNSYITKLNNAGANIRSLDNFKTDPYAIYNKLYDNDSAEMQKQREIAAKYDWAQGVYSNLGSSESGRNTNDYKTAKDILEKYGSEVSAFRRDNASEIQSLTNDQQAAEQQRLNSMYGGLNEQDLRNQYLNSVSLSDFLGSTPQIQGIAAPGTETVNYDGSPLNLRAYDQYGKFVGTNYNQNQVANSFANGQPLPEGQNLYTQNESKQLSTYGSTPEFQQVSTESKDPYYSHYDDFLKQFKTDQQAFNKQIQVNPNTALPSIFMGYDQWVQSKYPGGPKGPSGLGGTFI